MKRGHTVLEYKQKLRKLREVRPDISISSDFIVGFPGETEQDFQKDPVKQKPPISPKNQSQNQNWTVKLQQALEKSKEEKFDWLQPLLLILGNYKC